MTTILTLILILLLAATLAGLAHIVENDGYGDVRAGRTPPRSHVPDLFDPTRSA